MLTRALAALDAPAADRKVLGIDPARRCGECSKYRSDGYCADIDACVGGGDDTCGSFTRRMPVVADCAVCRTKGYCPSDCTGHAPCPAAPVGGRRSLDVRGPISPRREPRMTDDDLKHIFYDGAHKRLIDALRSIASAARSEGAEEERKAILHETGSTVIRTCAALVRLSAPDDVDEAYVPRAAVVDIAMGLKRDIDALRSRSAAGGQGQGGGNG